MLKEAGAEHGKALIVNTASIAGKTGQAGCRVYSATKAGVVGFSQATQKELGGDGIQVTALCPGFVDTPMTEFVKDQVAAEEMIRPEDIAESVRFLLRTSRLLPGARRSSSRGPARALEVRRLGSLGGSAVRLRARLRLR